MTSLLL